MFKYVQRLSMQEPYWYMYVHFRVKYFGTVVQYSGWFFLTRPELAALLGRSELAVIFTRVELALDKVFNQNNPNEAVAYNIKDTLPRRIEQCVKFWTYVWNL